MKKIRDLIATLIDIPTLDPDEKRRARMLNILLLGLGLISALALPGFFVVILQGQQTFLYWYLVVDDVVVLGGMAIIFFINRRSGKIASYMFLVLITIFFAFSDLPAEVANGRSLFAFTIPIVMASVLLAPAASFIFAALSTLIIFIIATQIHIIPNSPAAAGFFVLAFVSWISSRTLEETLRELRTMNTQLDKRVELRTSELLATLSEREAILKAIADGVVVLDSWGQIILVNPAASRLLDIEPDKFLSHDTDELLSMSKFNIKDREVVRDMLRAPKEDASSEHVELENKTLSVTSAPIAKYGVVAVFRDYTREAEADRLKSRFVAMVSHEFRTPLGAILGYVEILNENQLGVLNEEQRKALERVLRNVRRLLTLVEDLLNQAQIEAGILQLRQDVCEIEKIDQGLHDVMDGGIFQEKGLALESVIEPGMPRKITGDARWIQQVVVNLVSNAAKFTETGAVTVRYYMVDAEHWGVDVIDTGPGIPLEEQSRIFDPFFQLTESRGGVRLGLSIVKQLVDLMKSQIFVKSTPGKGTVFTIVLPIAPQSPLLTMSAGAGTSLT